MKKTTICIMLLAAAAPACRASIDNPTLAEYPHLGRYYSRTGQPELAIATYRAMLTRTSDTREAEEGWLDLGACYLQLMNNNRSDLAKAKAAGASTQEIEALQSKITSSMNQALASYRTVFNQFPASRAEAIIGTGSVYAAYGAEKSDEACREYAKVIAGYPEEAGRAQILTGDILAAANDSAGAKTAYRTAITSFPEVASLATLRCADLLFAEGTFGEAADSYAAIVESMGVDGAYDHRLHRLGDIMEKAVARRGEAERALGIKDNELSSYAYASTRYDGTQVGVAARMESAEALDYYGKGDEAAVMLDSVASRFPKSVWAAHAQMRRAAMRGASAQAAELYRKVAEAYPQSIFWIEAQMRIAETWKKAADAEEEANKKKELRAKARAACQEIIARWPLCPETARAKGLHAAIPPQ